MAVELEWQLLEVAPEADTPAAAAVSVARDLRLDADGDLDTSGGALHLVRDAAAVAQSLRLRMGFFRGEWFLDPDAGVPYWEQVLVKNPNPNLVRSALRQEAEATPGLGALQEFTVTYDARARTLSVRLRGTADVEALAAAGGS